MSNINTNIKVLREEARLSVEEFAEKMNVSKETVVNWEKGKQENGAHSKGILWRGVLCVSSASAGSARADSYRSFDRLLPSCCFGSSTCAAVLGNQRSCLYYM